MAKKRTLYAKKSKIYLYGNFVAACSAAIFLSDFICKAQVFFWGKGINFSAVLIKKEEKTENLNKKAYFL